MLISWQFLIYEARSAWERPTPGVSPSICTILKPIYISISLSLFQSISLSLYLSISLAGFLSTHLSLHLSISLPLYRRTSPPLYRYLSASPSNFTFLCLFLSVSLYLSSWLAS